MAIDAVKSVVQRAILDRSYRDVLFTNPKRALTGYTLTSAEVNGLTGMDLRRFQVAADSVVGFLRDGGGWTDPLWNEFAATMDFVEPVAADTGAGGTPPPSTPQPTGGSEPTGPRPQDPQGG